MRKQDAVIGSLVDKYMSGKLRLLEVRDEALPQRTSASIRGKSET